MPTVGILIVGNEVLSGKTRDENGPFLLRACHERGIEAVELRIVADSEPAIVSALHALRHRCTKLLVTGGIGPTHDDVTVRALAHAFGRPTVMHAELLARVQQLFGPQVPPAALRLAEVPEGAQVVLDTVALVPLITLGNVSLLPGVPSLVRSGVDVALGELRGPTFVCEEVFTRLREIDVAEALAHVQLRFEAVQIGSYPQMHEGRLRVCLRVEGRAGEPVRAAAHALRQMLAEHARLRTRT